MLIVHLTDKAAAKKKKADEETAAAAAAAATAAASIDSLSPEEQRERRIKALRKKLKQIEEVKAKLAVGGGVADVDQAAKIASEPALLQELASLTK